MKILKMYEQDYEMYEQDYEMYEQDYEMYEQDYERNWKKWIVNKDDICLWNDLKILKNVNKGR